MENEILENIELENIVVPNDDEGDLIRALFQAGFSDEETDLVFELVGELKSVPRESFSLDEEISKLFYVFEMNDMVLGDSEKNVIKEELNKRFE